MPLDLELLRRNLAALRARVADAWAAADGPGRGEDSRPPTVVVVSKYLDPTDARRLREAGIGPLAENRAGELCSKTDAGEDVQGWHFVGHLQRNKIARVLSRVDLLHSLDSARLAEAIDGWVAAHDATPCRCLIQINVSGEGSKGGLSPDEARRLIPLWTERYPHLRLEGLMTMAPLVAAQECRPYFRRLRELRDEIRAELADDEVRNRFRELSMGMSNDYLAAVAEGATLLRIGRLLYH